MPIYAYKCESCGFSKDVLQKMSDPKLTLCPACGAEAFQKQVTAAGFQLKGSGWYVTDFRGGDKGAKPAEGKSEGDAKPASGDSPAASGDSGKAASPGKADGSTAVPTSGSGSASTAAPPSAAPASAPAAAATPAAPKRKD